MGVVAGSRFADVTQNTFDYVIVGAGSAGAVLAASLSKDPSASDSTTEQKHCTASGLTGRG